jgi:hypothetical protein
MDSRRKGNKKNWSLTVYLLMELVRPLALLGHLGL